MGKISNPGRSLINPVPFHCNSELTFHKAENSDRIQPTDVTALKHKPTREEAEHTIPSLGVRDGRVNPKEMTKT